MKQTSQLPEKTTCKDRSLYGTPLRNLVEPAEFVELFFQFPPHSFLIEPSKTHLPLFLTRYDLLTTLTPSSKKRLQGIPFFSACSKLCKLRACFCGTSISEYCPLPRQLSVATILQDLRQHQTNKVSLVIIKDLPNRSPLLSQSENNFAQTLVEEAKACGFFEVHGQALAYLPIDFTDGQNYLSKLSAPRRKDIRRKLKKKQHIRIETLSLGSPIFTNEVLLREMYTMYLEVFRQSETHFDLLPADFFKALLQNQTFSGIVFLYRIQEQLAAYNICLINNSILVDKYIGFKYPLAREYNLYFISWMHNLEFACAKKLTHYVAGWTDPAVKASLGAHFTHTRHLVYISNPLLRGPLKIMRPFFESDRQILDALQTPNSSNRLREKASSLPSIF